MHRSGTQSSFFIRTVYHSRQTTCELPRPPLTIEPSSVEIFNYTFDKISVVQLTLRNDFKLPRKFKVIQPSKSYFSVKYSQSEVPEKSTLPIYVWFNPQKQKMVIEDELVIKVEGDMTEIHVPIICHPKHALGKSESKQKLSNRENQQASERRNRRPESRMKRMTTRNSVIYHPAEQALLQNEKDPQYQTVAEFEQRFRKTTEYVRQKYVKNEVYIGAKVLSEQKQIEIKNYLQQVLKAERDRLYSQVTNRFKTEYMSDGPIATTSLECSISWNVERNTPSITFGLGMKKLQAEIKKYVTSLRFEKIQHSLKLFQDYKKKEQNQGKKVRLEEYVDYREWRVKQGISGLDYELEFDRSSIRPLALPIQPEFKQFHGKFSVTQRVGFDNWVPINTIQPGSWQPYLQKEIDMPSFYLHHPVLTNDSRKGAPQQMYYKQANQMLKNEAQELLTNLQSEIQGPSGQQVILQQCQPPRHLAKSEHKMFYTLQQADQPDLINQQQFMQLGPLNAHRRKKTTAAIDLFGLLKNGDN